MPQMNLLPWRTDLREARKKRLGYNLVVFAIIGLCFVALLHFYFKHRLYAQQARNAFLLSEVQIEKTIFNVLNQKKKKIVAIKSELDNIVALRLQSYQAVRLLD